MSKTALFLRHAETNLNANPVNVGGRSNWAPLSSLGESQPADAAAHFSEHGITFETWYSSPAVRTLHTGRLLCEALGIKRSPVEDDRLQEVAQGIAEGQPRKEMYSAEAIDRISVEGMYFKFPGGESIHDAATRKMAWLQHWAEIAPDESVSLVTGHGFAIRCMVGHILGWDRDAVLSNDVPNCSLTAIVHDGDFHVDYFARKTTNK